MRLTEFIKHVLESSSDSGDPKCSKPHSKDNPDKGGGGKVGGKWVCNAHYPKKK